MIQSLALSHQSCSGQWRRSVRTRQRLPPPAPPASSSDWRCRTRRSRTRLPAGSALRQLSTPATLTSAPTLRSRRMPQATRCYCGPGSAVTRSRPLQSPSGHPR
eukprot:1474821-Rhodomonas_salina.2